MNSATSVYRDQNRDQTRSIYTSNARISARFAWKITCNHWFTCLCVVWEQKIRVLATRRPYLLASRPTSRRGTAGHCSAQQCAPWSLRLAVCGERNAQVRCFGFSRAQPIISLWTIASAIGLSRMSKRGHESFDEGARESKSRRLSSSAKLADALGGALAHANNAVRRAHGALDGRPAVAANGAVVVH